MSTSEAQLVWALKCHLLTGGLAGVVPARILVDADPSYIHSRYRRALEPMARVEIEGVRPDLLCSAERTEGILVTGFEVKAASRNWLQGLAQARRYRAGVHYSYLALPGRPAELEREVGTMARESGVGVLVHSGDTWHEVIKPIDPIPLPWTLSPTAAALAGVPLARQLQLNHPLNYLVVPFLAATLKSGRSLYEELEACWHDLTKEGTRRHAIIGAMTLRLVDADLRPTVEGRAVADLLLALGFTPETRPSKHHRFAGLAPALAAVARFVFLQQPAVRLILRSLDDAGGPISLPKLAMLASKLDPPLGNALFLKDPSGEIRPEMDGGAYNPSTVFKLKQNLWHSGLIATAIHPTAGRGASRFRPQDDLWALESWSSTR